MSQAENNDFSGGIAFDLPKNQSNVIKVIGVGGGGSNAINHMFRQGIKGVDFVICNTDSQALENSPVPTKIQLGVSLTEGLGAGANPDVGEKAALESIEDIKALLSTNTKMVFITAGMGGGTGTGAAPIIAKYAREMDILTVGIVTVPFQFEGKVRNEQAQLGVEKLRAEVDSLIVINNNKLREVYGNLGFKAGFSKADEVLATASRGIAEVITHHYTQNIDLKDAKTVLSNSGTAIMGSAVSSGSNRAMIAIEKALDSPLLNDNKITGAKNVLLLIVSGREEITLDEIGEINDHIQMQAGHSANIIMGVGEDESLEDSISITVIATGFDTEQQDAIVNTETKKIIHTLEDEQRATHTLSPNQSRASSTSPLRTSRPNPESSLPTKPIVPEQQKIVHQLEDEEEVIQPKENTANLFSSQEELEDSFNEEEKQVSENDLLATTDEILNIEVDLSNDFDFEIEEIEKVEEIVEEAPKNAPLLFDFPLADKKVEEVEEEQSKTIVFTLSEEEVINEIEVNDEVEILAEPTSVKFQKEEETKNEEQKKFFNLGDYEALEDELNTAKPNQHAKVEEPKQNIQPEEESLRFTRQTRETSSSAINSVEEKEIDPLNSSIDDLRARADERRAKMKMFNHQFRKHNNIDEIERQPAYKRAGIELDANTNQQKMSRTSLHTNENGDVSFRSNNSFLHDNVD